MSRIIFYPAVEIYGEISRWLDEMIAKGKLSENKSNPVTRGDVGSLNSRIASLIEKNNYFAELRTR